MSHNIHYDVCGDTDKERKNCEAYWNNYAAHENWQEGCSGLSKPIRWINHTCENEEEARAYIESHDKGWYDQLAVKFLVYPEPAPSKTIDTLKERADRLQARYNELNCKIHYKGVKSAFVTCRACGSKLSTRHVDHYKNRCPVCNADIRPDSTITLMEKAKENADKAHKAYREALRSKQEKDRKKAVVKWLVKIEYHT